MRNGLPIIWAAVLLGSSLLAQSPEQQTGAKALFFDSINDKGISPHSEEPVPTDTRQKKRHPSSLATVKPHVPPVTGIMYYVELLKPSGELARVNSDYTFRSGDRIRLHLKSNIDGNLAIYQSEDNSPPEMLYPSTRLTDASGRVEKGIDVVVPSPNAWFKFDNHPGRILLTLKLSAEDKPLPATDDTKATLLADASSAHDVEQAQKGSKALVLETDDSPSDASKVVVVDSRRDSKIPPGQIAVEISLIHRS